MPYLVGLRRAAIIALILSGIAVAQGSDDELIAEISGVRYPPLAAAAQVRGDIRLHVNSGTVTLLSGHPLLAQTAVDSAKSLGSCKDKQNSTLPITLSSSLPRRCRGQRP